MILGNTITNLLISLKLRSIGKNNFKYQSLASISGTTFLKSQIYTKETYHAMICRCLDENYTPVIFAKNFHKRIGYIFQNPDVQLFNATVYDEIAFGPRQMNLNEEIIHQRINELLIYLNIQHLQDRPPYHLSGGEQKKVALAAILALNPDVLMIDEPLNGLDNKTRQWFKEFLMDFIKANKTILISTHEQELLSLPHSRIIKFNDEHTILN